MVWQKARISSASSAGVSLDSPCKLDALVVAQWHDTRFAGVVFYQGNHHLLLLQMLVSKDDTSLYVLLIVPASNAFISTKPTLYPNC